MGILAKFWAFFCKGDIPNRCPVWVSERSRQNITQISFQEKLNGQMEKNSSYFIYEGHVCTENLEQNMLFFTYKGFHFIPSVGTATNVPGVMPHCNSLNTIPLIHIR